MPRERQRILILGGTAEARQIAAGLVAMGHDVTTSLAGVTAAPVRPSGQLRVGGFGGAEGLRQFLLVERIEVVVDATHPFAAQISRNACDAVRNMPVELVRFERAAWTKSDQIVWQSVLSLAEAAAALPAGSKTFVTTGRKDLLPFVARSDLAGVIRTVEPPGPLPAHWQLILDRPPHTLQSEIAVMRAHAITHLVSKNSGGAATFAKLQAASALGISIIMVERPAKPVCPTFASVDDLLSRLGTG
jgi:precorrin-6A/cobalt-precorrin-6A reductase